MSQSISSDRFSASFRAALVLLLLPAIPLFSQVRVSSVKDPAACPFNGLVSCGTAILSFSLDSGFRLAGASTPRTYRLEIDRLEAVPSFASPIFGAPFARPAIGVEGDVRQRPGWGLDFGASPILRPFLDIVRETPRAMVTRYTIDSESMADRVDLAIEEWAAACHANRATDPCDAALSHVVSTLRRARLDLTDEPFAYGAPWVTRLALHLQNDQLGLAYGEMEQGFLYWDSACNGDRGTSMGPRAATAFETGADRRVRVDHALGKLLISGL